MEISDLEVQKPLHFKIQVCMMHYCWQLVVQIISHTSSMSVAQVQVFLTTIQLFFLPSWNGEFFVFSHTIELKFLQRLQISMKLSYSIWSSSDPVSCKRER